jgi:hypothetical protein
LQADQLLRERSCPIAVIAVPPKVDPHVAAVGPTQVRKRLRESREAKLPLRIVIIAGHEHADAPHAVALLRVRRERPSYCAAEPSDEFAPLKANAHLPLPWPRRLGTSGHARLLHTGSRLQGEGLRP